MNFIVFNKFIYCSYRNKNPGVTNLATRSACSEQNSTSFVRSGQVVMRYIEHFKFIDIFTKFPVN